MLDVFFDISDFGFPILDVGFWMLDVGFPIFGCWIYVVARSLQNTVVMSGFYLITKTVLYSKVNKNTVCYYCQYY